MIVSSTYNEGPLQADNRRYVKETHIDDQGNSYNFEWLGDQNAQLVLNERVIILNKLIKEKRDAQECASGTLLPLTKYEFRMLFWPEERIAIDLLERDIETYPGLLDTERFTMRTAFKDLESAQSVFRPFLPDVHMMLSVFVHLGILESTRRDQILGAGNG